MAVFGPLCISKQDGLAHSAYPSKMVLHTVRAVFGMCMRQVSTDWLHSMAETYEKAGCALDTHIGSVSHRKMMLQHDVGHLSSF